MIDPIIQFLERLITQFSWRRLMLVLIIIFISIGSLIWFETYTGHFRFNKIENEIRLLSQLTDLSEKIKKENNDDLSSIFKSVTHEFEIFINQPDTSTFINIHPTLLKAISSAVPWVFMLLLLILTRNSQKEAFFGTLLFATIFIFIGISLPTYEHTSINYIWYPLGHFVLFISIILLLQRRKK